METMVGQTVRVMSGTRVAAVGWVTRIVRGVATVKCGRSVRMVAVSQLAPLKGGQN